MEKKTRSRGRCYYLDQYGSNYNSQLYKKLNLGKQCRSFMYTS